MTDDSLIAFLKWRDCLPVGMSSRSSEGSPAKSREIHSKERSQRPQRQKKSHVKTQPATLRVAMRALAPRRKEKTDSEQELTELTKSSVSCFSSCAKGLLGCEKKKDG